MTRPTNVAQTCVDESERRGRRAENRSRRRLLRAIADRCRGHTLLVAGASDAEVMPTAWSGRSKTRFVLLEHINQLPSGTRFATVAVVADAAGGTPADLRSLFRTAWHHVRPGGRMLLTVPNAQCERRSETHVAYHRGTVAELLHEFGKPELMTDQPFRWVTMCVTKAGSVRPAVPRSRRNRYRVTARLCRGRVLELGCGAGHLCKVIADRGHEVVGVDIAASKIEAARKLYPNLQFLKSDIRKLSIPDRFDTVLLAEVLEHVEPTVGGAMLSVAWDRLASGGRLVVSVPNEDCIPHRNHVREFRVNDLWNMLERFGSPQLVTDQPFKWLMMYVDKEEGH